MSRKITRNVGFRRFKVGMAIVVAGVSHVWMLWDLWMSSIDPLQTGAPGALFLANSSKYADKRIHDHHSTNVVRRADDFKLTSGRRFRIATHAVSLF